jgi:hypothetical protein
VVAPGAVDEKHLRGVALAAEPEALDESQRWDIPWLDIGFEPVDGRDIYGPCRLALSRTRLRNSLSSPLEIARRFTRC